MAFWRCQSDIECGCVIAASTWCSGNSPPTIIFIIYSTSPPHQRIKSIIYLSSEPANCTTTTPLCKLSQVHLAMCSHIPVRRILQHTLYKYAPISLPMTERRLNSIIEFFVCGCCFRDDDNSTHVLTYIVSPNRLASKPVIDPG